MKENGEMAKSTERKCTMTYEDGTMYEGDWREGQKSGNGKYFYDEGGMYDGDYQEDNRHGNSTYYYPDGGMYEGKFSDSNMKMHGNGTHLRPDGAMYQGELREGKKHSTGIFTFGQDGCSSPSCTWVKPVDMYHGPFATNKRHGIAYCAVDAR